MEPDDIIWKTKKRLRKSVAAFREQIEDYDVEVRSLRLFICSYFNAHDDCSEKLGKSISPVAGAPNEGKGLKVRWNLPGEGKSGGLRLAIVAYCERRTVVVCEAFRRRSNPSDDDFREAMSNAIEELD